MILSFTAIDKNDHFRDFFCQIADLEIACDLLSRITMLGDTLVRTQLIDEGNQMELPIDAFDGAPFSESMQQLETQWQEVLNEPVRAVLSDNTWQVELTRHQIDLYEIRIEEFGRLIGKFEGFRQRADAITHGEPWQGRLIRHYDSSLITYRGYIDRAKSGKQAAQQNLICYWHNRPPFYMPVTASLPAWSLR